MLQHTRRRSFARTALLLGALAGAGCAAGGATGDGTGDTSRPPHVFALSAYAASVGTLIEAYGSDLPDPVSEQTTLVFRGTFEAEGGRSYPVDTALPALPVDGSTLRWTSLGPYALPFGPGNLTGTFRGTIAARAERADGTSLEDPTPTAVTFEVKPSVVVREFQPLGATCGAPVTRALGGAPYRLRVEAVGFEPKSFTYSLAAPALRMQPIVIRHLATGPFDGIGDDDELLLPQVPDDRAAYPAVVTVVATAQDGRSYRNLFSITVRRPLEVFYNGNVEAAQVYAAAPVSACIPGGTNGRHVNYEESETETRMRTFQVSWNQNWLRSTTRSHDVAIARGRDEANSVALSTMDGTSFNWTIGTHSESSRSASIPLGKAVSLGIGGSVGMSSSYGSDRHHSEMSSESRTQGVNQTEARTVSETDATMMGGDSGQSISDQVSSSNTIASSFGGTVLPGTFGVFYRQTIRLVRRAAIVTYNQCGAATVVGDVDFYDWTWSPDLAMGPACPPLPESSLPKPACYVEPCDPM